MSVHSPLSSDYRPLPERTPAAGIMNGRSKSVTKFIPAAGFLIVTSLVLAFFIKYTYYAPDAYVFVQYAYMDSIERSVDINSVISNNFIFDLMIVVGDALQFYAPKDWISYTITIYVIVFAAKYVFLLRNASLYPVVIVYLASFFIDINQLRFNLALVLLFACHINMTRKKQIIFLPLSFLAHVIPVFIYIISVLKRRPAVMTVFLALFGVLFSYTGYLSVLMESRLLGYTTQEQDALPKVLLLFFPLVYGLVYLKNTDPSIVFIRDYCIVLLMIGIAIAPVNYFLTARFFETSFLIFTVFNCLSKGRRPELDLLLLVSSLAVMSSRLFSGIRAGADFAERYVEVWKF